MNRAELALKIMWLKCDETLIVKYQDEHTHISPIAPKENIKYEMTQFVKNKKVFTYTRCSLGDVLVELDNWLTYEQFKKITVEVI